MAAVTIRDVARKAGVGIGTVSRVLNDSPMVSEETRRRVQDAIEVLDYSPSSVARRLSLGRSMAIAVIAPFFTRRSHVERLQGIEHVLSAAGYDLILYNVESVARRDECLRTLPRGERLDGLLILSLAPEDDEAERLARQGVPTVLVDAYHPLLPTVSVDNRAGGSAATHHLIELGHERIGYVGEHLEDNMFRSRPVVERFNGYRAALAEAGIPFRPEYHFQGKYGWRDAHRMALQIFSLNERPTALFAYCDTMAFGVLEAAQKCDISVPAELSVIGFDDVEITQYFKLTTVRQPLYESGARGAELLLEYMDSDVSRPVQHVVLPTELVVRQTTTPPAEIHR